MKRKISKWIARFYFCKIWGLHNWTNKGTENPNLLVNDLDGFLESCRCYCSRCGKTSTFSIEFENEIKNNKLKNENS